MTTPTAAPKQRAYLLRATIDRDTERCMIVFAESASEARKDYRAIDGATHRDTTATRAPEFDDGFPTGADLMAKHGWQFVCHYCGDAVRHRAGEPAPVILDECGCASTVAHAACHAKAEVRP